MSNRIKKSKAAVAKATTEKQPITAVVQSECPPPEAFLEEAKKEPKRTLLMDYIGTIKTLRQEKKFTYRAIAEWFGERGIETDHSAIYRTLLAHYAAITPPQERHPDEDWSETEEPDYGDENVIVKKP